MFTRFGRHIRQQYAGFLALFVALGGVSYAAVTLPANSVGSVQIKPGAVKNSDLGTSAVTTGKVKDFSLLSKDFKPGQLVAGAPGATGATGPKGNTGAAGATGLKGDTGATGATGLKGDTGGAGTPGTAVLSGLVKTQLAGTTVVRGGGLVSASRLNVGVYQAHFNRAITACTFLASYGDTSAAGVASNNYLTVEQGDVDNRVIIRIYDPQGLPIEPSNSDGFHIAVFC